MAQNDGRSSKGRPPSLLGGQLALAMLERLRTLGADTSGLPAQASDPSRRNPRRPETEPGQRVYAIGDVHGRLDLLRTLIRTLEADAAGLARDATRMVFLGDLIDRGPNSRQVLELVRFLQCRDPRRVEVLLGNHEEMLLAAVAGEPAAQRLWLRTGGDATLRSYRLDPDEFVAFPPLKRARLLRQAVGQRMVDWLEARPVAWQSGSYYFCHAGVRPGVSLDKQRREDLLWIRGQFLESTRTHGAVIVHGHSETEVAQAMPNRINVDTGAWRTGQLTAVGLHGPCRWFVSTAERYLSRSDLDDTRARRSEVSVPSSKAVGF